MDCVRTHGNKISIINVQERVTKGAPGLYQSYAERSPQQTRSDDSPCLGFMHIFKTAGLCSQLFSSCGPVNSSSDGKYDVFALFENVKIFEAEFAGSQCKW